jgi:antitoxin (DNA-binding transcriptional repressor) of toxin-antitoxin stability system
MKSISIRELHMHTGKWVRQAAEPIIIMDRGRAVAELGPLKKRQGASFCDRKLVRGFASLPVIPADSGSYLEEDRR